MAYPGCPDTANPASCISPSTASYPPHRHRHKREVLDSHFSPLKENASQKSLLRSLPGENLYYLSEASVADLCAVRGVGSDKAVTICAAVELGRRIARQRVKQNAPDFSTPAAIAEYVMEDMRFLPQEQFRAVYLSTKNQLIAVRTLTIGTINSSLAKSREVFRFAIQYNAAAVVLVHNHPSGDPAPSSDDIAVTRQIAQAGHIMEIPVLDHIIIGDGTFSSLCELGYM